MTFSGAHQRRARKGERERCTGNRLGDASPCSAPEENAGITMAVCVCVFCVGVGVYVSGLKCFFFFFHKQTGGL